MTGLRKRLVFAFIPVLTLVAFGETAARIKLYRQHKDRIYLFAPFVRSDTLPQPPVEYRLGRVNSGEARDLKRVQYDGYFKFAPGTFGPMAPYTATFRINSLGFRGAEFDPFSTHAGVTRIFCLGESPTFGAESPDDATWPARLSFYLGEQHRGAYEVINAGFPAYKSDAMLNLIKRELATYHPDVIIVYAGGNDVAFFENNLEKRNARGWVLNVHRLLYYRSMLYTLSLEKISVMINKNPVPLVEYEDKSDEVFLRNMAEISDWANANGVRRVVVRYMIGMHPSLFMRDSFTLGEAQSAIGDDTIDKWGVKYPDYRLSFRNAALMGALKKQAAAEMTPFVDVRGAFDAERGRTKLMVDFAHFTPAGNDLLAREIARALAASLP